MNKIKVAAYCRVSTDSRDQANSLVNQESYFSREIEKNPNYELVKIYPDKGITGTKLQRPEFDHMLTDAGLDIKSNTNNDNDQRKQYIRYTTSPSSSRKPKFNLIFVKNTSRFARNTNVGQILDDLKANKVYVHFLDLNKSTENESDMTILKFFFVMDENESRDKSVKVRFGQKEGTKHGIIHTSSKLYGYKYIKSENRLEIIPEEAEVVRTIYNLYASGLGIRQILNTLHNSEIKTRQGKDFCKNAIRRILDNEKYAGKDNSLKYDTGIVFNKNSYPKVKKHYEIKDNNKIPAIISWELFQKCKEILHSKVNYINQKGVYKGKSKYSGLIHCGFCGALYYANQDRGRKFYNCANKKSHGLSVCQSPNISEEFIDYLILRSANEWLKTELHKAKIYARDVILTVMKLKEDQYFHQNYDKIKELKKQITETTKELNNFYTLFAREVGNKELVLVRITDLENQLKILQDKYNEATKPAEQIKKDLKELSDKYIQIDKMYEKYTDSTLSQITKEDALQLIDNITIVPADKKDYPDGWTAKIHYTIVEQVAKMVDSYKQQIDFKSLTAEEAQEVSHKLVSILETQ